MFIGPEGPTGATVAIVGEKGGRTELSLKRPFVGDTGKELDGILERIGSSRAAVYLTNAVKNTTHLNTPTEKEVWDEVPSLMRELAALPNLKVIVPLGNTALNAVTGYQLQSRLEKNSPHGKPSAITKFRGSILPSLIGTKIVPAYHPAFYLRGEGRGEKMRHVKSLVRFDIARALEESYDSSLNLPQRKYFIAQTRSDVEHINSIFHGAEYISFDIELLRGRYIECIAFSKDPSEAYCIPITTGQRENCWSLQDECYAWQVIQSILNQPSSLYVSQNGLFDCWHLWRHGIQTPYMANGFDTMLMHRVRAPGLPHDLGFLVSIYTREPYYKDESGDWKAQIRAVTDTQFRVYNCKDSACTLEVAWELIKDLQKYGMLKYFRDEIQKQWSAFTDMRQRGMRVDLAALRAIREQSRQELTDLDKSITTVLGWSPNTRSAEHMERLYKQLGIKYDRTKPTRNFPAGKPKIDKERIYSYAHLYPKHRELLYEIATLNARRTLVSGFLRLRTDRAGFYHPQLDIHKTVTGRAASKGDDVGGPQIQNIPERARTIFVSDNPETDELTNVDQVGAEALLLTYLTEDPLLLQSLEKHKKIHDVRGAMIFHNWTNTNELPPDSLLAQVRKVCDKCKLLGQTKCNHSEYYISKQTGHASAYLEGPRRMCLELRKQGLFIQEAFAKQIQSRVVTPHIRQWHVKTENDMRRDGWLTNCLGRKRQYFGAIDDSLIRAALSDSCQSVVAQITHRALCSLHSLWSSQPERRIRVWTTTHDSITATHPKSERAYVIECFRNAFNIPLTINGRTFVIPIDFTHGPSWGELK